MRSHVCWGSDGEKGMYAFVRVLVLGACVCECVTQIQTLYPRATDTQYLKIMPTIVGVHVRGGQTGARQSSTWQRGKFVAVLLISLSSSYPFSTQKEISLFSNLHRHKIPH